MLTYLRIVRIVVTVIFGGFALLMLAMAIVHPERARVLIPGMLFPLFFVAVVNVSFWLQRRSFTNATARILETMQGIAARLFDAPVPAEATFDGAALLGGFGDFIRIMDGARWPAAHGTYKGANVLVTSHASFAGRQMFEMTHTYSYVVVDVPGFGGTFNLTERSKIVKFLMPGARDVKIQDPAFEAGWVVDADENLARSVLTPSVRARLVDLRSKVSAVSVDFAQGRMSVRMTPQGLALRWPGDLSVELAAFIRDLLMDLRASLKR